MNATESSQGHRPSHSLTDRYVHATTRAVPQDRRDDLGAELRSTVDDMVQARIDAGQEPRQAEHDAIAELGDPALLAARYTQAPLHLLGPTYYLVWKRLLVRLLAWIPALVGSITGVVTALESGTTVGDVVASTFLAAASTAIQISFWLTLVFVFIDRVAGDADVPEWTPDQLPEVPVDREHNWYDAGASIAFDLTLVGLLVLQHFRSWVEGTDGTDVPLLDPLLWWSWLPALLLLLAVDVCVEVWKARDGWTVPVVGAKVATSAAFWTVVVWLGSQGQLLNPELVGAAGLSAGDLDGISVTVVVGGVVLGLFEVGDALVKGARNRQPRRTADSTGRGSLL